MKHHITEILWMRCLSMDSQFCEAVVCCGYLTQEQMLHAACHYRLGASRQGGVIFWQIDQEGRVHDGKVMYYLPDCHRNKAHKPTWVSYLLRRRDPFPNAAHETSHCFFGLHLVSEKRATLGTDPSVQQSEKRKVKSEKCNPHCCTVAVVEAEKTAVILSELYPQYIWLASGGLGEVQPDKFRALRGCKVILFPDTDPDGIAYSRWSNAAEEVMRSVFWEDSPPIRVSRILEDHATEEQKRRKIDLVDFITESSA
jgi:hypothetical protein